MSPPFLSFKSISSQEKVSVGKNVGNSCCLKISWACTWKIV
uniref:Uncharacterized protein n=1 Tax=Anguilla anguilla TaxID=7936 RepID=A0A0E9WMP4_ANGAN